LDIAFEKNQCFPFYTYAEDGTHRRENITDWALEQFRARYHDPSITKWDIFHYIYAVLHHPEYRERYAANLRRDLPHPPRHLRQLHLYSAIPSGA
jgi:predicted helicase